MTVLVTVGIDDGRNIPVGVLDVLRLRFEVRDEMVDDVGDGGWGDPFAGMYAAIHPHRLVSSVSVRDFEHFHGTALRRGADRRLGAQIRIRFR